MVVVPAGTFVSPLTMSGFPTGTVALQNSLQFTTEDLAHALFTTGRAPGDQANYGAASWWEFLHRVSVIPAYVRWSTGGRLRRSRLALELDRSEKGSLSYALGQAMCAIFCRRVLGVAQLLHIDRYQAHFGVSFGATKKRADLFGLGTGGWVIAEAKGRSNSMDSDLIAKLIAQKRSVTAVNGSPPWVAIGSVESFPPGTSTMRMDVFDPDGKEPDAIQLRAPDDNFLLAYYSPFVAATDVADGLSSAAAGGVAVGLHPEIDRLVRRALGGETQGLAADIRRLLADPAVAGRFLDGSVTTTNWDEAITTRDWDA